MKGESIEVLDGSPAVSYRIRGGRKFLILMKYFQTQTVVINGQAYQIVTPISLVGGVSGSSVTTTSQQSGSSPQFSSTTTNGSSGSSVFLPAGSSDQQIVTVQSNTSGSPGNPAEEAARKSQGQGGTDEPQ